MVSALMSFAGGALLFRSPEAYLRLRTRILMAYRASYILYLYIFAVLLRTISTVPAGLLDSLFREESAAANGTYTLVKLLLFRTPVAVVWATCLVW